MNREIVFEGRAFDEYSYWKKANNQQITNRIKELIKDIQEHPFTGIGKPEPLKGNLNGYWSRRINQEHRLVYTITENEIIIVQCRFHY